ncbi:hypothetical protein BH10BAC5_BH10BAC5_03230 [soil metagenome]
MKKILRYSSAVILLGFGLLTLFLSTSIILDLFDLRIKEGNYVLFVVWSNFISSILYLLSAYGFMKSKKWTIYLLGIASIILIVAFISLKIYISNGGVYETRTVGAMIFRTSLTVALALAVFFTIPKDKTDQLKS